MANKRAITPFAARTYANRNWLREIGTYETMALIFLGRELHQGQNRGNTLRLLWFFINSVAETRNTRSGEMECLFLG